MICCRSWLLIRSKGQRRILRPSPCCWRRCGLLLQRLQFYQTSGHTRRIAAISPVNMAVVSTSVKCSLPIIAFLDSSMIGIDAWLRLFNTRDFEQYSITSSSALSNQISRQTFQSVGSDLLHAGGPHKVTPSATARIAERPIEQASLFRCSSALNGAQLGACRA